MIRQARRPDKMGNGTGLGEYTNTHTEVQGWSAGCSRVSRPATEERHCAARGFALKGSRNGSPLGKTGSCRCATAASFVVYRGLDEVGVLIN